jgi:hypothetical protein
MEDYGEPAVFPLDHPLTPEQRFHRRRRNWGLTLALTLLLGLGTCLGMVLSTTQSLAAGYGALGARSDSVGIRQMPTVGPGTPGPCGGELTVTHVTSKTITATRSDGSTATIHVTARTGYTKAGHTVTKGAVVIGSKVYIVGM